MMSATFCFGGGSWGRLGTVGLVGFGEGDWAVELGLVAVSFRGVHSIHLSRPQIPQPCKPPSMRGNNAPTTALPQKPPPTCFT
jgi:hypothetical protein